MDVIGESGSDSRAVFSKRLITLVMSPEFGASVAFTWTHT